MHLSFVRLVGSSFIRPLWVSLIVCVCARVKNIRVMELKICTFLGFFQFFEMLFLTRVGTFLGMVVMVQ